MTLSPCAEPGCPTLTPATRCEPHTKAKRRAEDRRRPTARQRGYGLAWQKTRLAYLRAHPVCEDESGCIAPATDVDHIDGLGPKGPKGHDPSNFQALCHSHHSKKTYRSEGGGFR